MSPVAWKIDALSGTVFMRQAADIYASTWGSAFDESLAFLELSASMTGFLGRVAVETRAGTVVGMGFGARAVPGLWWRDRVADTIGHVHPALQEAWVLGELAVRPNWRGQGLGSALHDVLLAAQPCPRVLLTTQVENKIAQAFYRRRGWIVLHNRFTFFEGAAPFMVMSREMEDAEFL